MAWTVRFLGCFIAATTCGIDLPAAETSSFKAPSLHGIRIDYCQHFGGGCGKPAADLFCREMGFAEAARFVIDENIGGRGIQTLVFGDGRTCDGPDCSGFRTITCSRPDQQAAPVTPPPAIAIAPILPLAPPPPATTMVAPAQPAPPPPTLRAKPVLPLEPPPPAIALRPSKPTAPPAIALKPLLPLPKPPIALKPPVLVPLPPKKPEDSIAVLPKPPTKSPPGSSAPSGPPIIAMPAGATLIRCTSGTCEFAVTHDFDIDPKDADQKEKFIGNVEKIDLAGGFRWQVTTLPFPAFQSGSTFDLKPPGLAATGDLSGKKMGFYVDFKTIVGKLGRGSPPPSLYIRILPLAKAGSDIIVGQPSNAMRVYYGTEPPPQAPIVIYDTSPPKLFTVKVVSFTPPNFEDPNRWGCVTITGHKGNVGPMFTNLYPIGAEFCPASYKGGGYQITSFGEFVDWATGGVADAVDWVAEKYEDLKQIAVDVVMKYTPFGQACDLIGKKIDDSAPGYCELAAHVAVNAGLAALGVPPSIPNYNELIDKGVDHAVDLAAAEIYEQTGVPCEGPCRDALREGFGKAAEELKNASYTPGCTGEGNAHEHGREPLCLPWYVVGRPAPGAVYTPPLAEVEVTRNFSDKDPKNAFKGTCHVGASIRFDNHFSGGTVWGPSYSNKTMEVAAQDVTGYLYQGESTELSEVMVKGSKKTLTFTFDKPVPFLFPWTKQLWQKSQIPPQDFMGGDWYRLYWGGVANVIGNVNCAVENHTLAYQLPTL